MLTDSVIMVTSLKKKQVADKFGKLLLDYTT